MNTMPKRLLVAVVLILSLVPVRGDYRGITPVGSPNRPQPQGDVKPMTLHQPGEMPSPAGTPMPTMESMGGVAESSQVYGIVDGLIWTRSMSHGPLLVNARTGGAVLNTQNVMNFDWSAGPRVTLGMML